MKLVWCCFNQALFDSTYRFVIYIYIYIYILIWTFQFLINVEIILHFPIFLSIMIYYTPWYEHMLHPSLSKKSAYDLHLWVHCMKSILTRKKIPYVLRKLYGTINLLSFVWHNKSNKMTIIQLLATDDTLHWSMQNF